MSKIFLVIAAINGFLAVTLGAFGAHGLKGKITDSLFSAYETAVQYHFYHTLALFGLALLVQKLGEKTLLHFSGWFFIVGMVLFCGSLYALALGAPCWLGPVTPLGGVALLVAWALLLIASLSTDRRFVSTGSC